MRKTFYAAAAAISLAAAAAATPAAASLSVINTNGGDGYVIAGPAGFDFTLIGANNHAGGNVLLYVGTATADGLVAGEFTYTTYDEDDASYDPAGYFLNGSLTQLSDDNLTTGESNSGVFSFNVVSGDLFGFYVGGDDNCCGEGQLSVALRDTVPTSAAPEPGTWALMILGMGGAGALARRRRSAAAVA